MLHPYQFYRPLVEGAPSPYNPQYNPRPVRVERAIHFAPLDNDKIHAKVNGLFGRADVVLSDIEDGARNKETAMDRTVELLRDTDDFNGSSFWVRTTAVETSRFMNDVRRLVEAGGDKIDVLMIPKVTGPEQIQFVDRYLASLEAEFGLKKPIDIHPILETPEAVVDIDKIAGESPRLHGISLGPADLAATRGMSILDAGGVDNRYAVSERVDIAALREEMQDPKFKRNDPKDGRAPAYIQDPWHYTVARLVDACTKYGIKPYYGPFGQLTDLVATQQQFMRCRVMGCVGAWSLTPDQLGIAETVFSPTVEELREAQAMVAADASGQGVLRDKFIDPALAEQARVIVRQAEQIATKDPEYAKLYGMEGSSAEPAPRNDQV